MEKKDLSQDEVNQEFLYACAEGNIELITYYLTSDDLIFKAEIDCRNNIGFKLACGNDEIQAAEFLLDSSNIPKNVKINAIDDKLMISLGRRGYIDLTERILKRIEDREDYQEMVNIGFRAACENGKKNMVRFLLTSPKLKKNAEINATNKRKIGERIGTIDTFSGLAKACQHNQLEIIEYLLHSPELKKHADIKEREYLPFKLACRRGNLDIIKYMLNNPSLKPTEEGIIKGVYAALLDYKRKSELEETIKYFVFDYKIPHYEVFQELIQKKNLTSIGKMFESRNLNDKLQKDLSINQSAPKIIKKI